MGLYPKKSHLSNIESNNNDWMFTEIKAFLEHSFVFNNAVSYFPLYFHRENKFSIWRNVTFNIYALVDIINYDKVEKRSRGWIEWTSLKSNRLSFALQQFTCILPCIRYFNENIKITALDLKNIDKIPDHVY